MADLTALVFTVAPPEPVDMPGHTGRAAYALLLRLLDAIDSPLAQALHQGQGPKPFTCTTLVGGERVDQDCRRYVADKPAWLRFTGLNAAVSEHLERIAASPPVQVELDGQPFRVISATINSDEHEWAGQSSYEAIGVPYLLAKEQPRFRLGLYFASPTAFRSQGKSQPIPMPHWVFGSLMDRWNHFSAIQLPSEVRRFAEECVVMSQYWLHTRVVPVKKIPQMGCVGRAWYVALNQDKYWTSLINMLANYAFYSGIGYQTTVGMGQARRIVQ